MAKTLLLYGVLAVLNAIGLKKTGCKAVTFFLTFLLNDTLYKLYKLLELPIRAGSNGMAQFIGSYNSTKIYISNTHQIVIYHDMIYSKMNNAINF